MRNMTLRPKTRVNSSHIIEKKLMTHNSISYSFDPPETAYGDRPILTDRDSYRKHWRDFSHSWSTLIHSFSYAPIVLMISSRALRFESKRRHMLSNIRVNHIRKLSYDPTSVLRYHLRLYHRRQIVRATLRNAAVYRNFAAMESVSCAKLSGIVTTALYVIRSADTSVSTSLLRDLRWA